MSKLETLGPISAACAVTAAAMYPVDVLRALKMASATGQAYTIKEFVRVHGLRGVMSQGLVPEITRATWMRILKFFLFPIFYEGMFKKPVSEGKAWEKGLAGALCVIPEVATITSLELAKIGLQLDSEKRYGNSTIRLFKDVYQRHGFNGLMAGWQGCQVRQSLWTGTFFASLDGFKRISRKIVGNNDHLVNFLGGFGAGVLGAAVNTPFDVVRTNLQKSALHEMYHPPAAGAPPHPSAFQNAFSFSRYFTFGSKILQERGLRTLYNGFLFKSFHTGGSGACVALLIPWFTKLFGLNKAMM